MSKDVRKSQDVYLFHKGQKIKINQESLATTAQADYVMPVLLTEEEKKVRARNKKLYKGYIDIFSKPIK